MSALGASFGRTTTGPRQSVFLIHFRVGERRWKYDWVIEFDIHKAFDELDPDAATSKIP